MLHIIVLGLLFINLVKTTNITSTDSQIVNNQTISIKNRTNDHFLPMMEISPFWNYNGRAPFSPLISHYYENKGVYNPRNTAVQFPSEHFPYIYDSNPNFGHHIVEQEAESSLKPSARHFVIVSFIGLLLLFAVVQNTMEAIKRKTALVDVLSSRKKRDLSEIHNYENLTVEEQDIVNGDARLRCLQWVVCLQNRELSQDFGTSGKILAKYLTRCLKKSLSSSSGWVPLIEDAGTAGFRGEDCNILYGDCN